MRILLLILLLAAPALAADEEIVAVVTEVLPDGRAVVDRGIDGGDSAVIALESATVGQAVRIRVRVPDGAFRTVFWPLAKAHIDLVLPDGTPLYTYRQLRDGVPEAVEARMLAALARAVRGFAEINPHAIRGSFGFEAFPRGRYVNRTPAAAMRRATPDDARNLILHVTENLGPLAAVDLDVRALFGEWVKAGAPPSVEELIEALLAAPDWSSQRDVVRRYLAWAPGIDPLEVLVERARRDPSRRDTLLRRADVAAVTRWAMSYPMAEESLTAVVIGEEPPLVLVDRGGIDGVVPGWAGEVRAARTAEMRGHARVAVVDEYGAKVRLLGGARAAVGDVVVLRARRPMPSGRTILTDLARHHIGVKDAAGQELIEPRSLIMGDGPAQWARTRDVMLAEIRAAAPTLEPGEPFASGRYRGQTLRDVCGAAGETDLLAYLSFLEAFPQHRGLEFQLVPVFQAWLQMGAPAGTRELVDRGEMSPAVFEWLLRRAQREIAARRFDSALALIERAAPSAGPRGRWLVHLARARVYVDDRRDAEAEVQLDAVFAALDALENPTAFEKGGRGRALALRGVLKARAGEFKGAFETFQQAGAVPETPLAARVEMLLAAGPVLAGLDRADEARALLRQGVVLAGRMENLLHLADLHLTLAELEPDAARADAHYGTALAEYVRVDDRRGQADTHEKHGAALAARGDADRARPRLYTALALRRVLAEPAAVARILCRIGNLAVARHEQLRLKLQSVSGTDFTLGTALFAAVAEWGRSFDEAQRIQKDLDDRAGRAGSLFQIGLHAMTTGDHDRALEAWREAVELDGDGDVARRSVRNMALLLQGRGEYDRALPLADRHVELAAGRPDRRAKALHQRGLLRQDRGELPEARADFEGAVAAWREAGEGLPEVQARLDLADVLRRERSFRRGLAMAMAARARAMILESAGDRATAGLVIGAIHTDRGDLAEARKAYGMDFPEKADGDIVDRLLGLARHEQSGGRFAAALEWCDLARRFAMLAKADAPLARVLLLEAEIHRGLGDPGTARDALDRARALTLDPVHAARVAHGRALLDLSLGEGARALEGLDRAVGSLIAAERRVEAAEVLLDRAAARRSQGDLDGAARDVAAAESGAPDAEGLLLARMRWERSAVELARGDFETASTFYVAAVKETRDPAFLQEVTLAMSEAVIAYAEKDPSQVPMARFSLRNTTMLARQRGTKISEASLLELGGRLELVAGRPAQAKLAFEGALVLLDETGATRRRWSALHGLSRAEDALGDLDAAVTHRREAVALLDEILLAAGGPEAQDRFLRSKLEVYESFAELLGRVARRAADPERKRSLAAEAQRIVARARFEAKRDPSPDATENADLARYREKERERVLRARARDAALDRGDTAGAARLTRLLTATDDDLYAMYVDLRAGDSDLEEDLHFDPDELDESARELPPGATLVAFFPGRERLFAWVYTREGFREWWQAEVGEERLSAMIEEYRKLVLEVAERAEDRERPGRGFGPAAEANESNPEWYRTNIRKLREVAEELHRILLSELPHVHDAKPLIILPYGRLSYLPFESLIDGEGRFFGEDRRLVYVTSERHLERVLPLLAKPAPRGDDLWVGFVNPDDQLREALGEAEAIRAHYARHHLHTHATGSAHEGTVAAMPADSTVVHFATHGRLNAEKPSLTALSMDPNHADHGDGSLTQAEVKRLRRTPCFRSRSVRLVVLSACSTALAQKNPRAEILGLPDAFRRAGAPAIVASLWDVYTYSTSVMMEEFYLRYAGEGLGKAAALQGARKHLITARRGKYAHPYFWAPFLLFGDWR